MTETILSAPTLENYSFSVGQILRTARLERGLTHDQISNSLCIPKRLLSYLEEDAEQLVSDVYTLGFLKLYAQYLELNTQALTEKFKDQTAHHPLTPQLIFPAPLPGRGIPSFPLLALSLFVLAAIIIGWKWLGNDSVPPYPEVAYTSDSIEDVNLQEKVSPPVQPLQPSAPVEAAPLETVPSNLGVAPSRVHLYVTGETWIEVKDTEENIIISRLFQPGETFEFNDSKNLILKTANLMKTYLSSEEKIFPGSGTPGEVGTEIPLNPEKWID